jgi:anion-transporting  ArsA/GET3 family ATPase
MNQNLSKIIQNSHATIVEVPRGYGFDFAKKQIEFPAEAEIIDFLPQIHTGQKTEIINTDDILEIQQKIRGKNSRQQFIIFHSAEKMNEQAQNKFLKSLEEPRSNLHFVLLANSAESFLPTVRSRSQIASEFFEFSRQTVCEKKNLSHFGFVELEFFENFQAFQI